MNINKKKTYLYTLCYISLALCMLTGCKGTDLPAATEEEEQSAAPQNSPVPETEETDDQTEEASLSEYSIAFRDWEIKRHAVPTLDNVYELPLGDILTENVWVIAAKPAGHHFVLLTELAQAEPVQTISLIDPLAAKVLADATLPTGMYLPDSLSVSPDGKIVLVNQESREIYVMDESLAVIQTIPLPYVQTDQFLLSDDRKFIYYADPEQAEVKQYDTQSQTARTIFEDISLGKNGYLSLVSLMADSESLLFTYFDEAQEKTWYEIRSIATGDRLYKEESGISNVHYADGAYLLQYDEGDISEIIYRRQDESPQVLMLNNAAEYGSVHLCPESEAVFTSIVQTPPSGGSEDRELPASVTWNYYDLTDGLRKYSLSFQQSVPGDSPYLFCEGFCLRDTDTVLCHLSGDRERFLVWDLKKEESLTGDDETYLYPWQDPENPDRAALDRLRAMADRIGKENDVEIYFGEDVKQCPADIYEYQISNNTLRIERTLRLLKRLLAKYPKGMLAQLDDGWGSRLHIYLCGGITPIDEVGLAGSAGIQNTMEGNTYLVLDLSFSGDMEGSIYHEIFHAIDKHLDQTDNAYLDYEEWDALNPADFVYDYDYHVNEENFDFDYTAGDEAHEAYFVDCYSKSFPVEDRARIMQYAMMDDESQREVIKSGPLQAKLRSICEQVRKGFDTAGWPAKTSWEEALTAQQKQDEAAEEKTDAGQ